MTIINKCWLVLLVAAQLLATSVRAQPADTTERTAPEQPIRTEPVEDSDPSNSTKTHIPENMQRRLGLKTDTEESEQIESTPEKSSVRHEAIFRMGSDAVLKAGHSADAVVVINGTAKIHGKVHEAVVAVGGDIEIDGDVRNSVVAVLGSVRAKKGAKISGDVITVGGTFDSADEVDFSGTPVEIDLGGLGEGLKKWVIHCVLKLRLLAPQVGWVWVVAGFFFLIYLLVAAILPAPVQACVNELTKRPVTTFFMGLLAKILVPLVLTLLAVTGVGVVVIPFIVAALVFGAMIGKVALLERIGSGLGMRFGISGLQKPLAGFLVGIVILTVLYMVPVLGLITFGVVSLWGLGCAVTATFSSLKREAPEKPPASPPSGGSPVTGMTATETPASSGTASAHTGSLSSAAPFTENPMPGPPIAAGAASVNVPEVLTYPKARFWERMGAAFLDIVLISIVGGITGSEPLTFFVGLAYFAGLWTWKGTTIGGIVLGLKVVRFDGQPVSFTVAIVRALASAFSAIVLFLGFLWIAWDRDKQGWHDKIAGTVVLRLPRGTPLVCI
jgi:uncharacterized RDD family membrane protein YckC